MTEQQLIDRCIKGDAKAQKSLYDTYSRKMMGVCMRYCGNDREQAEDLLQDGFIKVFTSIKNYQYKGSFEGWIRRIMVNVSLDWIRGKDILKGAEELEAITSQHENYTAVDNISAKELMEIIAQLPTGFRTIFNLYAVEGYTHKEIAKQLNITESTSRSQLTRAKQLLQKKLIEFYGK